MKFEEVGSLLTQEKLPYLSAVERLPGGILHVAVLTRMLGVSPKRWHPRDHVWMSWANKRPGTHVGARHLVHEYIGGRLNKLCITFVPPEEFFSDALTRVRDALAVCARPGLLDRPVDLGRMVHLALPTSWGCELHSRFWLGYVAPRDDSRLPIGVANTPWARRVLPRISFGRALAVHWSVEVRRSNRPREVREEVQW
jgi:hypothetical protein